MRYIRQICEHHNDICSSLVSSQKYILLVKYCQNFTDQRWDFKFTHQLIALYVLLVPAINSSTSYYIPVPAITFQYHLISRSCISQASLRFIKGLEGTVVGIQGNKYTEYTVLVDTFLA